jgi:(p)ppGpp synthase/HD superfamily hydrolase
MDRLPAALLFAERVHHNQRRKGTGIPYIAHVMAVAALVLEHGGDEDEAIGALLHDAAEDGGGEPMLAEIRAQFGDAVGDIVLGCSDSLVENPAEKRPWLERKQAYVEHVAEASASVCLVSAADKLHNVRALTRDYRAGGEAVWSRFNGGRDGSLWYYDAVSLALWHRAPSPLTQELRREVQELRALAAGEFSDRGIGRLGDR